MNYNGYKIVKIITSCALLTSFFVFVQKVHANVEVKMNQPDINYDSLFSSIGKVWLFSWNFDTVLCDHNIRAKIKMSNDEAGRRMRNLRFSDSLDYYFEQNQKIKQYLLDSCEDVDQSQVIRNWIELLRTYSSEYKFIGNYNKAFLLMNEAMKTSEILNDSGVSKIANIIYYLPFYYYYDNAQYLKYYDEILFRFNELKLKKYFHYVYSRLGNIAYELENHSDAKWYYLLAINEIKNQDIKNHLMTYYYQMANIYYDEMNLDSSRYYNNKAVECSGKLLFDIDNKPILYQYGKILYKEGKYDSCLYVFLRFNGIRNSNAGVGSNFYLGVSAKKLNKFKLANSYFKASISLNDLGNPIEDSLEYAEEISDLFIRLGDYKRAYTIYRKYVPKSSQTNRIALLYSDKQSAEYQKYRYHLQLKLNELDKELQLGKQKIQKTMSISLLGGSGGAILLLVLAFINVKNKRKREVAELISQVGAVEMKSLRSQMNPHFIFNSLQSIQNFLINNKSEDANEYLLKFSKLMRLVLENSQQQEVALKDDIQALDLYMQLEQLRFTRPFEFEIILESPVDPEVDTIPPLLLQPFVENAIWHGLQYKSETGKIIIRFKKEKDVLICVVEDNGVGRSYQKELKGNILKKESLGVKLTEDRINLLQKVHGVEARLSITDIFNLDNKPAGTRVEVMLPMAG